MFIFCKICSANAKKLHNIKQSWVELVLGVVGTSGFFSTERPLTANGNLAPGAPLLCWLLCFFVSWYFALEQLCSILFHPDIHVLSEMCSSNMTRVHSSIVGGEGDRRGNDKLIYIFLNSPLRFPTIVPSLTKVKLGGLQTLQPAQVIDLKNLLQPNNWMKMN